MEWISIKEKVPDNGQVVIIYRKNSCPFLAAARYVEIYITREKEYKNCFHVIRHPRMPEKWVKDIKYSSLYIIPRNKIIAWMPLPEPPN